MQVRCFPLTQRFGKRAKLKEILFMLHSEVVLRSKGTIEGNGLFATHYLPKETLIWQLRETNFTWAEVETWQGERLSAFKKYGFQCGVNRFSLPMGASREMNHSCDPSTWWDSRGRLIARHDIFTDDEITYDYSSCDIDLVFEMVCHCGSPRCRKNISNKDNLDFKWQQQYGLNLPPHVLAAIENTQ